MGQDGTIDTEVARAKLARRILFLLMAVGTRDSLGRVLHARAGQREAHDKLLFLFFEFFGGVMGGHGDRVLGDHGDRRPR